jgi:ubiquinone/menaquinone biosynthesis C-methylase UbiE
VTFYDRHILPWVLDHAMRRSVLQPQRRELVSQACGDVLEIGFGSGLNLPFYPEAVKRLTAIEPSSGMTRRARRNIETFSGDVAVLPLDAAQRLPLPDAAFDTVVSTWTLCTIPDVAAALREAHRVLRPGGTFLFLEHGLSPDPAVAAWQRRLTPLSRRFGGGCHLDRDIAALLRGSPLSVRRCETFYLPATYYLGGYTYRGAAVKPPREE